MPLKRRGLTNAEETTAVHCSQRIEAQGTLIDHPAGDSWPPPASNNSAELAN